MHRVIWTLLGLLAMAGIAAAQDNAQALLDKAIQARGGADKLSKVQAYQTKTKGSMENPMFGTMEFTGEGMVQFPDKNRIALELQVMGQAFPVIVAFDGKEGWREIMGQVQPIMGPELKQQQDSLYVDRLTFLTPLKEAGYKLEVLPEANVAGKPAVGLKVNSENRPEVKLWFDKGTHHLVKIERKAFDRMSNAEIPVETLLSGHKEFGGVQFPTKSVVNRDGKKAQEVEFTEVKIVDKIDPKMFAKPG